MSLAPFGPIGPRAKPAAAVATSNSDLPLLWGLLGVTATLVASASSSASSGASSTVSSSQVAAWF